MPLPTPKPGEPKDDFTPRCMGDAVMLEEYPDEKVRAAVCNSQWARSRGEKAKLVCASPIEDGAPTQWQLWPRGWVEIEGLEPFFVDDEAMMEVLANFERRGNDMVIDYEHQTLSGEKAPAAGWITGFEIKGDGLWVNSTWTPTAQRHLEEREYRYFSPVFDVRMSDRRPVAIHSVALTNSPLTNQLRALVNKLDIKKEVKAMEFIKQLAKALKLEGEPSEEQVLEAIAARVPLAEIAKVVGIEGEATQEKVIEAIKAKMTASVQNPDEVVACKEILELLELKEDADKSEAVATVRALKQGAGEYEKLATKVATLETENAKRVRDELVAKAVKEGKITPAQREWAAKYALEDSKGFEIYISKAPVVVPVEQRITDDTPPEPKSGLDDTQRQINKMLGISNESWEKYNPKEAGK